MTPREPRRVALGMQLPKGREESPCTFSPFHLLSWQNAKRGCSDVLPGRLLASHSEVLQ